MSFIWYGYPAQSPLSSIVPQRHCFSMVFSIFLYTLGQSKNSNTNLNNLFFLNINIKVDELLSEIDNVLQKGEFKLTM